jgi:hypothetical protein
MDLVIFKILKKKLHIQIVEIIMQNHEQEKKSEKK